MTVIVLKPAVLNKTQSKEILSKFQPETQSYRIVEYLSNKKKVSTGELASISNSRNISQIVRYSCNPRLMPEGLQIRCEKLVAHIKNKFDQDANQYTWSLYRVVEGRASA